MAACETPSATISTGSAFCARVDTPLLLSPNCPVVRASALSFSTDPCQDMKGTANVGVIRHQHRMPDE
jgi:hypothetical protein